MFLRQRETLDIVQPAIVGLGDDGQVKVLGSAVANSEGRNGVTDEADLIGIGYSDRRAQQALLRDPGKAGHLAVAIE